MAALLASLHLLRKERPVFGMEFQLGLGDAKGFNPLPLIPNDQLAEVMKLFLMFPMRPSFPCFD